MDVLVGGEARLTLWEGRPPWPGIADGPGAVDRRDVYEREVARESPGPPAPGGAHRRVADAILSYRIFPPRLVTGVMRRAPVEPGDVVGIRYHVFAGIDLFFAARVVDCFDGADGAVWRTGFTYRTLVGHPELGEETFSVDKALADGRVVAALRSWSRPGTLLARAAAPLVRRLQVHASHAALDHLAAVADEA